jgi:S-methylmethionine-dependent homocysteine/selenocysteine methylase
MAAAARGSNLPIWLSYTLRDEIGPEKPARLRSGEAVEDAVSFGVDRGARAILFNCSQPEVMNAAVQAAAAAIQALKAAVRIGAYANAFVPETAEPYAGISEIREDLNPARYLDYASRWVQSGASIVGGCCGIGPEHIAALRAHLR